MRQYLLVSLLFLAMLLLSLDESDPYLWLEEVEGERALAWVKERNQATKDKYESRPEFQDIYKRSLAILDSPEKLVYPQMQGDTVYNFWKDQQHKRGLLRRLPLESFVAGQEDWETVLDIDALAELEGENWVYQGHLALGPDYDRTLIWLSRGGSDASVLREFDLNAKRFAKDGFHLPEAKSRVAWCDRDTLYVGTDFGPDSMTDSGYPRFMKVWQRGTPLSQAKTLLEVAKEDVAVHAWVSRRAEGEYHFVGRAIDFWTHERFLNDDGTLRKLRIPADVRWGPLFHGQQIFTLRSDWVRKQSTIPAGCVVSMEIGAMLEENGPLRIVHNPEIEEGIVIGLYALADHLVVNLSKNVKTGLHRYWLENGEWHSKEIEGASGGTTALSAGSSFRNDFFFTHQSWLTPATLNYLAGGKSQKIQSQPARFPAEGMLSEQHWATSKDGTKVPYYVVRAKDLEFDGKAPTLLYGYGGFEVSLLPSYLSLTGPAWLERGGVYVSANIRGGGEFGPAWHQAALRENRPRAFEDFEAVAEDLIAKGITSPSHLGIHGASNGGLLVGSAMTRRPDLYNGVLIGVPLLDMKRYHKLLSGASWMAEYGDPDNPEDWAFLKKYSPYHNVKPQAKYPAPLLYTSTKDDRVHPGHARKMAARMLSLGHKVEYYENLEGGHAGSSNNPQVAYFKALSFSYLLDRLK